jgi:hypothetical protein
MVKTEPLLLTKEVVNLMTEIDEFKGAWLALLFTALLAHLLFARHYSFYLKNQHFERFHPSKY